MKLSAIKDVIRSNGYAWPGGYPIYFVTSGCDALSIRAARECWREIVAAYVNWEDETIYCDHTGAKIESAYGEA